MGSRLAPERLPAGEAFATGSWADFHSCARASGCVWAHGVQSINPRRHTPTPRAGTTTLAVAPGRLPDKLGQAPGGRAVKDAAGCLLLSTTCVEMSLQSQMASPRNMMSGFQDLGTMFSNIPDLSHRNDCPRAEPGNLRITD